MEIWLEKKECTGCGACVNICPKNAIKMVEDECGFAYPVIDHNLCIDCGLCKKTCPVSNLSSNTMSLTPSVYACWSLDEDKRFKSTSGGAFSEIVIPILENGGYVVGAAYNEDNLVEHKIISKLDDLEKIRQSKYLQSDTKNVYKDTKELLDKNQIVAFCGSPCQIAALKSFLKKKYDNLLTIEFICRGMNSPKAYKCWLSEIEHIEKRKVNRVWFKYKVNGWKTSPKCTRVDFDDGNNKVYDGVDNKFMSGYLGPNLYIRPSCGNCRFNGIPRQADITLADFWGIDKSLDDDKGTSLVLINSDNGKRYFDEIKNKMFYDERSLKEIYDGNVCFNNSVVINKKSEEFLKSLTETNFTEMVNKYSKRSIGTRLKNKLKKIFKIK